MLEYRAYTIGPEGRIIGRLDLRCVDQAEARKLAKETVDGHPVELWQGSSFLERFEPDR